MKYKGNNWFEQFLLSHKALYEQQIQLKDYFSLIKCAHDPFNRQDKEMLIVAKRHFGTDKVSNIQEKIKAQKEEVTQDIIKTTMEFLGFCNTEFTDIDNNHHSNYINHNLRIIQTYLTRAEAGIERPLNAVIAFDAVTNLLHHSIDVCGRVAKHSPITANKTRDTKVINQIVKSAMLNGDVYLALNNYYDYKSG